MLRTRRQIGESIIVEDSEPIVSVTLTDRRKGVATITLEVACIPGDSIDLHLAGEELRVEIGDFQPRIVKMGIDAPPSLQIRRGELPKREVTPTS